MGFINSLDDRFSNTREGFQQKMLYLAQISYEKNDLYQRNKEEILNYIKNLNEEDNTLFFKYYMDVASKKPETLYNNIQKAEVMTSMNLTVDEIKNAKKNPHRAKISRGLLSFLISSGGCIALNLLSNNVGTNVDQVQNIINSVYSVFATYISMDLGINLFKYMQFKKTKENLMNDKKDVEENFENQKSRRL